MEKAKCNSIPVCLLTLVVIVVVVLLSCNATSGVSVAELDAAMSALRAADYNLFPNAIDTTDLRYRFVTAGPNSSFTLFAPPDRFLFTLDFTSPSAEHYFLGLLRHVSPLHLASSELLGLARQVGSDRPLLIPTLMPNHSLQLNLTPDSVITVGGVRISSPGIYLGHDLAVHGLNRSLMEHSSTIPREYYEYPGWGRAPGSDPEMVPDLDLAETASPGQHRGGQKHGRSRGGHSRRRNRKKRNHHRRDDNHVHSHIAKE